MAKNNTGTVARVVQLLRHLAEAEDDTSVHDVSTSLDLPPSTVHRLLRLLRDQGMVEWSPKTRRYQVGLEYYRLSSLVLDKVDVVEVARPVMDRVVEATGESCGLSLYRPADQTMMYAAITHSSNPLSYRVVLNQPLPLAWGASGQVIVAHLPEEDRRAVFAQAGPSPGQPELTLDAEEFDRRLQDIRERGYGISHGEKLAGAVGIAAPVFGRRGQVVGSLALTIPEIRFEPEASERLGRLIAEHAEVLSRGLGGLREGG